jgi:mRNA-degrading endonuclease RelE of RelBE toxin-antitoxin system
MNYKISFQERAQLALENLSKQAPVTFEKALEQVKRLQEMSQAKDKKQRS